MDDGRQFRIAAPAPLVRRRAGQHSLQRANLLIVNADMEKFISRQAADLAPGLIAARRDLHRFPETARMELRTASLVFRHLSALGYGIRFGREAMLPEETAPAPSADELAAAEKRAVAEGADPDLVRRMRGGHTALWADLPCPAAGKASGPLLAFRFDMDANTLQESASPDHRPYREGFASVHPGCMHACGHDGHTAIGLALAELLVRMRTRLRGTVRLIFQPAEESGGGAEPMLAAGVLDKADYLVGLHLGIHALRTGDVICGTRGFMACTGFDLRYTGVSSHSGLAPHEGRNALLAACSAVLGMHAVPRHGGGASRINVGCLHAGRARNAVPDEAVLTVETRGITTQIDEFMRDEALRIAHAAGRMWNCDCGASLRKSLPGGASSPEMSARIAETARRMPAFTHIETERDFGATEDFTLLLDAVQKRGGQGGYIQLGTDRAAGHHNERFDYDEAALPLGLELLARIAADYLNGDGKNRGKELQATSRGFSNLKR